jgi:hypothetical protein
MSSKIPITATFEDVQLYVYKLVNKARRKYNLDPDEVMEAAYLGFMQAWETYRNPNVKFLTWCGRKVSYRILDLIKATIKQRRQEMMSLSLMDVIAKDHSNRFNVEDWLKGLSADARLVAKLIIDPPIDIRTMLIQLKSESACNWRYAIRDYLRDLGWSEKRMKLAFTEIRQQL